MITSLLRVDDKLAARLPAAQHLSSKIEMTACIACGQSSRDSEVIAGKPGPCVHMAISRAIGSARNPMLAQVCIEKNGLAEARKFGITGTALTALR